MEILAVTLDVHTYLNSKAQLEKCSIYLSDEALNISLSEYSCTFHPCVWPNSVLISEMPACIHIGLL